MGIIEDDHPDPKLFGLRIYQLIPGGPLEKSGVKSLSDFIIPPQEVQSNNIKFDEWVHTHANQEIKLSIYSLLSRTFRDIKLKTNELGNKDGILGASVNKENWSTAHKNVLHIISVEENSFAKKELGLISNDDYIIAVRPRTPPIISLNKENFNPLEILGEVVRKNKGEFLKFYIYNKIKGPREVSVIIGNEDDFVLGCEGAFGALHEFPLLENKNDEMEIKENNENYNKNNVENKIEEVKNEISKNEIVNNEVNKVENINKVAEEDKNNEVKLDEENDNNEENIQNKEDNNKLEIVENTITKDANEEEINEIFNLQPKENENKTNENDNTDIFDINKDDNIKNEENVKSENLELLENKIKEDKKEEEIVESNENKKSDEKNEENKGEENVVEVQKEESENKEEENKKEENKVDFNNNEENQSKKRKKRGKKH